MIHESWKNIDSIRNLVTKEGNLVRFLKSTNTADVQPHYNNIYNVFSMSIDDIKVVLLGQDPYQTEGVATGYSFAVSPESRVPVSLRNMHKLIEPEMPIDEWKTLQHWKDQGVFLLNTALTVETGNAGSHLDVWKEFTETVIGEISKRNPCVWLLLGKKAQGHQINISAPVIKSELLDDKVFQLDPTNMNVVVEAVHPAAEAYGGKVKFSDSDCFNKVNDVLSSQNKSIINW